MANISLPPSSDQAESLSALDTMDDGVRVRTEATNERALDEWLAGGEVEYRDDVIFYAIADA